LTLRRGLRRAQHPEVRRQHRAPQAIARGREVHPVVGELAAQRAVGPEKGRVEIDPGRAQFAADAVERQVIGLDALAEHGRARQQALHEDVRGRRLAPDPRDDLALPREARRRVGRGSEIVGADHQEHRRGPRRRDRREAREHAGRGVAGDAAIAHRQPRQQLAPVCALGQAVAEEHDVAGRQRRRRE